MPLRLRSPLCAFGPRRRVLDGSRMDWVREMRQNLASLADKKPGTLIFGVATPYLYVSRNSPLARRGLFDTDLDPK